MPESPLRKVLLIGWDVADWDVALPLLALGAAGLRRSRWLTRIWIRN